MKKILLIQPKDIAENYFPERPTMGFGYLGATLEKQDCKHVYQMYTIKLSKEVNRTKFVMSLRQQGIEASVHFDQPVHLHPFYKESNKEIDLPVTEEVSQRIVTLPMFPSLTREQLNYIVTSVNSVIKQC